jgi:bifunctional non-homologous end joining protein LigD
MAKSINNLEQYKAKRNFAKTPEPKPIGKKGEGNGYLIQKHAASHLHYDFRLELDGVLKSWAVPKGPSLDPHDKRLAMQVEDHPVDYGSFEGIIPQSEYGGGTVMLWDRGTWEPAGDPRQGLAKGKLVFTLHGEKLHGEWTLVKTFSKDKRGNSWLLIKHKDEEVRKGNNAQFLEGNATSVVSGRTMDEIANDSDKVWKSNREHTVKPLPAKKPPPAVKAGTVSNMPGFTPPQLATLSTTMPKGAEWVHEIKFDGYRMISHIHHGNVQIFSRNGKDWTAAFQSIAHVLSTIKLESAILDGELVVADKQGKSNFMELENALSNGEVHRFQYYLFDLLYLNGADTTKLPLLQRKELLAELLTKNAPKAKAQRICFSEHFTVTDDSFFQNVCSLQLEGVVSKRADAPYHVGRSKIWLKTKCQKRQEFVIGGFTLPSTGALGVGALLLGYYDDGKLEFSGRVGTGFTKASSMQIRKLLDKLRQKDNPYVSISTEGKRGAIWVKPQLVGEVEFTEWTPDGSLRHPSFKGLREDKPATSIVKEIAISPKAVAPDIEKELEEDPAISKTVKAKAAQAEKASAPTVNAPSAKVSDKHKALVGGISISHPQRVIYPGTHITKQELAEYYLFVSDKIMPHIVDRPLSMVRCPEGASEPCFFQRHVGLGKSPYLHEVSVGVKGEARDYLMIHDVEGLISLVQWGEIELHPWQCAAINLDKPDRIIFDLDPDPSVSMKQLIDGAQEVRQRMHELGLSTFLKTTGGKGLHVVVPMTPSYSFPAIKAFARAIAESMASDSPTKYIANMSKAKRTGKIFVDYLRNDVTSTAVAPYSARAREGATVSTPLGWKELTGTLKLSSFTIDTVPQRLKKQRKDPWQDFSTTKQKIAANYLKALKIEPK